jgi:hypothetical protein
MDCEDEFARRALCAAFSCCSPPVTFPSPPEPPKGVKDLSIQLLVLHFPVKALTVAVLPRTSWLDTERIDFSRWSNQLSASSSDTKETQKEKEATTTHPSSCVRRTRNVRKRPTPGACSDWLDIMRRQKSRIAHQRCKAEESSRGGPRACADSPLITESETRLPPERTLTRRPAR